MEAGSINMRMKQEQIKSHRQCANTEKKLVKIHFTDLSSSGSNYCLEKILVGKKTLNGTTAEVAVLRYSSK